MIGASELLSSCAITRITFFQITTSCAAISRVSCLKSSSRCGWLFRVNGRWLTWNISASVPSVHREERVHAAVDRVAQRLRRILEQRLKLQSLDLAAGAEELARGDVAEDDRVVRVRQHERERRRLHHGIEQEFALVEVQALAPKAVAERVVLGREVADLVRARSASR